MSLTAGMSQDEIEKLSNSFKKLQEFGIFGAYNLTTGDVKIKSKFDLIKRMEYHTFRAFKLAFPDTIIRKPAVDLYLASVMNDYKKKGFQETESLVHMMVSLEQESDDQFETLSPFLKQNFAHYNFEKIKTH